MATNIIRPVSYPNTPFVSWVYNGVEQVVAFANADDAKDAFQALYGNYIAAGFSIPEGYKEIPHKHHKGDGLLSEEELAALQKEIANMVRVGG